MFLGSILPADYPDFEEFGTAPCAESDPDAFFPEDRPEGNFMPNRLAYPMEREAKMTCLECPYKLRCLEYALKNEDLQGIWGGFTESERRKLRRGIPVRMRIPEAKHI
jgi:WhiB family redox-sensing transcriptional regulator